jgi:hypothetical protein
MERESSELGAVLWQGFLNDGISVRNRNGSTTIYEVRPVMTVPALGDFRAWEARRHDIQFLNRVLMGSAKGKK